MAIFYHSTRNSEEEYTASAAILQGLCRDGGLFVPSEIPALPKTPGELSHLNYRETALEIMRLFFTDFTEEELRFCIDHAYDSKFDTEEIVPLVKAGNSYYMELFHGKTIAFKDMALSILPYLMTTAAKKNDSHEEIVILTATSGDTGKAALAGFSDVEGTRIAVFYPKDGVSPVQKRQMVTQKGDNTFVVGVDGNFDDCQTGVKRMFSDETLRREAAQAGFRFSSANSINIGRLVPQIVYYVFAYTRLLKNGTVKEGEPVNFVVPTGNFGNILAALYAKKMGLPVKKLICASNENRVLFDFFRTGVYDRNRPFVLTSSPSMDILISSNLERLIYHISGNDARATRTFMKELEVEGTYRITPEMEEELADFAGYYATEEETSEKIGSLYRETGYVLDPHTAVAACACDRYLKESGDDTPVVTACTASPYKFMGSVMKAIGGEDVGKEDLDMAEELSALSGVKIPAAILELRNARVRHTVTCAVDGMEKEVRHFLGLREA